MTVKFKETGHFSSLDDFQYRFKKLYDGKLVYLIELDADRTKVGITSDPISRMYAISRALAFGESKMSINRVFISTPKKSARFVEQTLLQRFDRVESTEILKARYEECVSFLRKVL